MEDNSVSEGATQEPEMVPIHEASAEDLDAFLQGDTGEGAEVEVEGGEEEHQEESEPEAKNNEEPKSAKSADDLAREVAELKEKHERLLAHTRQVELWNKRQGTELGEARKRLREIIEAKSQGLDERFLERPTEALKDIRDIEEAQRNLQHIDAQELAHKHIEASYQVVTSNVAPEEFDLDTMAECLQADGLDAGFVNEFKQNPYANAYGETLIQLAKRATAEKRLRELVGYTRRLMDENQKLKSKPKDVLRNVERAARQTPTITGANGGIANGTKLSAQNLTSMSDAELQELLRASR